MRRERKYHYIYKTTCKVTGKFYVGMHSTDNLEDGYLGSGKKLWHSIRKHGIENHEREILEFLPDRSSLKLREAEIVNEKFLEDTNCLNLMVGGGGGFISAEQQRYRSICGGKASAYKLKNDPILFEQFKLRSSLRFKQIHASGNHKYDTFTGRTHTEETRQKIGKTSSKNQSGDRNSQHGTCWITNGTENKKIKKTDELPDGWAYGRKM